MSPSAYGSEDEQLGTYPPEDVEQGRRRTARQRILKLAEALDRDGEEYFRLLWLLEYESAWAIMPPLDARERALLGRPPEPPVPAAYSGLNVEEQSERALGDWSVLQSVMQADGYEAMRRKWDELFAARASGGNSVQSD
jgi:hypothetical protein